MLKAMGLSQSARIAWYAVAFMLFLVVLPAIPSTNTHQDAAPKKKVYEQSLVCYEGTLGNGTKKLICDYPSTPSVWTPPN